MNKIKATKKEMKQNYKILGIGYCDLQYLLSYQKPVAYSSSRMYGWLCDYYNINGVIISTGYNHIDTKNMKDDYALVKEYEQKARKLSQSILQTKKVAKEVNKLLFELLKKLELNK